MSAAKIRGSRAGWRSSPGLNGDDVGALEEKLRIVAETEQPGSGIAEIARRYEISRGLLWNWRSQVRRGVLRPEPPAVFLPVRTISEPADWQRREACGAAGVGRVDQAVPVARSRSRCPTARRSRLGMMSAWRRCDG